MVNMWQQYMKYALFSPKQYEDTITHPPYTTIQMGPAITAIHSDQHDLI